MVETPPPPTPETQTQTPSGEFKEGVVKFLESQSPAAHSERIMGVYDNIAGRVDGKPEEVMQNLRPTMEKASKVLGWGVTAGEVATVGLALKKVGSWLFGRGGETRGFLPNAIEKSAVGLTLFGLLIQLGQTVTAEPRRSDQH
ncbi:hypothetical protein A2Z33_03550 [Candidatus Gottesmanbacteria bacterium RBG_16_52_11]|uniref:Uncharacterized protein n=1 Tax=Candidatus Gottesmanbacteria bacterium RBG_16_52_11 TaxID=1798374 RepID=A0A1F5YWD0_9BACT|nr:MAG: hypothetical protein A2Z33_03550 [Candidatus Gottesmanbacteria bacterium RBG_16_52_11]